MHFFDASISSILKEGLLGSASTILNMVLIILPLMVVLEFARYYQWIDKLTPIFAPILKKIGLGNQATFPLLVGISFGILYGSGIMIDSVEEGEVNKREVSLILIFLVACHAIFEDTFIFWTVGGNFPILFFGRLIGAYLLTWIFSKIIKDEAEINEPSCLKQMKMSESE
ncbi:nucleoside recognition domain-containing protein [Irregularibacter muris]|uniref:Nucleoside recognition domain-containing protein n=1 Tax=Irregularibacter muris TaxID=1796619 RepID=A0AAE3HD76_9FIRM|nr:nucleoside recognition domain-containing protein [Irregularibacter muris]MCR1897791.1 nucleoside recognition domain-containing protein [Irregularibacter muris]